MNLTDGWFLHSAPISICFCATVAAQCFQNKGQNGFPRETHRVCQSSSEEILPKCTLHSCLNHFHFGNSRSLPQGIPSGQTVNFLQKTPKTNGQISIRFAGNAYGPQGMNSNKSGEPSDLSCWGSDLQMKSEICSESVKKKKKQKKKTYRANVCTPERKNLFHFGHGVCCHLSQLCSCAFDWW